LTIEKKEYLLLMIEGIFYDFNILISIMRNSILASN